jgi:flagellar hook-associated protein FlgK
MRLEYGILRLSHSRFMEAIMAASTENQGAVERVEELADEVLGSLEDGRKSTVQALRKFTSTLQDATSKEGDPSRRQALIDAAVNLADELSAAQMQLIHSITGSMSQAIRGPSGGTKE